VRETFLFLTWVNTHLFHLKIVAFFPKFSGDSYVEFQEKTISGDYFRNFVQTKAILYQNFWNSHYFLQFIMGLYCVEKVHTSTFICGLHPGKEARP